MKTLYLHNVTLQELRNFNALCQWLDIAINVIAVVRSAYEHMYSAFGQREKLSRRWVGSLAFVIMGI